MAENGKKIYSIQINGIQQSIDAIEALNSKLNALEQRIKSFESKSVKVNISSNGSKATTSSMDEEAKLAKQIEQIDAKRQAYSKEIYQNYLAAKDVLSETVRDQKEIAAAERLQADAYSNTMNGIKEKLKDLKTLHFSTDISTDEFAKQTEEINELTQKLKELEEAYGQFGRNVGNYQSAFDGISKVSVNMGGVVKQFDSLKQATKAIRDEMGKLEYNGQQDTKMYKQLENELGKVSKAQLRLNSAMKDAKSSSKAMDDLLDTMESFTALGQVGQGFSTLFGLDNTELEQQIAKLVALQNVLQGIEKIRQQMNTREGIGKWLGMGSDAVDKFVMKITGAQKRMGMLVKDTRAASIAVQRLSTALKALGGIAIAGGLMLALDALSALVEDFKKWRDGGYKAGAATDYLTSSLEAAQKQSESLQNTLKGKFLNGFITEEEYARESTKLLSGDLANLRMEYMKLQNVFDRGLGVINSKKQGGESHNETINRLGMELEDIAGKIDKLENGLSGIDKWSHDVFGKFFYKDGGENLTKLRKNFQELGIALSKDLVGRMNDVETEVKKESNYLQDLGNVSDETKQKVANLAQEMEYGLTTKALIDQIDKFDEKGQYSIKVMQGMIDKFLELSNKIKQPDLDVDLGKIAQMNIDAMPEGMKKQRAQIELNRRQELADAANNEQLKKAINAKYNREILEAEKTHGREMAAAYADLESLRIEIMDEGWEKEKARLLHEQKEKIRSVVESEKLVGERKAAINELYEKKIKEAERQFAAERLKIYEDLANDIQSVNRDAFGTEVETALQNTENQYNETLRNIGKMINQYNYKNFESMKAYFSDVLIATQEQADKEETINQKSLDKQYEYDVQEEKRRHDRLVRENGDYAEQLRQGKITKEQYDDLIEKENEAHLAKMNALDKKYNSDTVANTQEALDKKERAYSDYYTNVIAQIRKGQDEIVKKMNKAVVTYTDKNGLDSGWGVINYKATKENYAKLIDEEKTAIEKIKKEREQLYSDKDNLSGEYFKQRLEELDAAEEAAKTTLKDLNVKSKEAFVQLMDGINYWMQAIGQAVNSVLSSISEITDNHYQAEIDKQQEYIDEYEDLLDKQKDITQQHADEVNSIEEELSNARGDRRQHLIDQLNAEMAAQRASLAQEKKIEREKQKAEEKQKKLEHDQAVAKKRMQEAQAYINMAMAISMAAVNSWPIPAVPMMALAAATGAAQIAAIKSQNIPSYGSGGVIQGKSHAQGGVKVLGGQAEVEGGEFITNKRTTAVNVDLLEFINTKKRRVNLDDLLEFYGGNAVRKNIQGVRTKFADGGVIPTLRTDLNINDRLINVMEDYSNRPVQVAVVDIIDRTQQVNNVKVMAGLDV